MRSLCRALLARSLSRTPPNTSSTKSLVPKVSPPNLSSFPPHPLRRHAALFLLPRLLSTSPALDDADQAHTVLAEILSNPIAYDEIKSKLAAFNISLDDYTVESSLQSLAGNLDAAQRFFNFLSEGGSQKPNSRTYNTMLEILGVNNRSDEFWTLAETMKAKGYGISKATFLKVSESFSNAGMTKDSDTLKQMYFLNSHENLVSRACPVICKILRVEDDSGEIRNKLQGAGVELSSDLVVAVLDRISPYPRKALVFFEWVEGSSSFKIDARGYNSMARVVGREDCIEDFWEILHKMRSNGYELEMETYNKVLGRFLTRKMSARAVDLYEFAMGGSVKPSLRDFIYLLKKVVSSKDLDMDLISRVVRVFVDAGNSVNGSTFDAVLKSLRSVCRLGESDKVLKAMEKGGFVVDSAVYVRVVELCEAGRLNKACENVDGLEISGISPDVRVPTSLVRKHIEAGELDNAVLCFRTMVDKNGGDNVGSAFEALVNCLCKADKLEDAFKILKEMVTEKNLKPRHSTYKFLIESLLSKGRVKEASIILGFMKSHGFPPFIDPFIDHISQSGSEDDAMGFLKAVTTKKFPSRGLYIRLFEALLKAGKHDLAHNLLSQSPGSVSNHEDVLNLFYSMKLGESYMATSV